MKRPEYESQSPLTYEGPEQLRANQLFSAILRVHLREAVQAGGHVVIATRHVSDFGDPQMDDPRAENYITVGASRAGLAWSLGPAENGRRHPWNRGIDLKLLCGELLPGDTVTIRLGEPAGGCPGYRCQSFAERLFQFRLGIDPAGKNAWLAMPEDGCPGMRIVGNAAAKFRVTLSDMTGGGPLVCHVKAEDAYGNVAGAAPESVRLLLDGRQSVAVVPMRPGEPARAEVPAPADGGWHTLVAATDDGAHWAESNPAGPSPVEGYRLYWGEIHSQSQLCDGTASPRELYEYAREAAGLDFASVTSHDFELTARDWREIQQATREAHKPGQFVTFLGYEWSGRHEQGGDNNVYYLDDEGPLVYSAARRCPPAWDPAEGEVSGARTLTDVVRELRGRQFMVVPHCGGRQCNFDYHDAYVMPLLEVHSCHRSYEHVAREALSRHLRVGFIGGSDDHRGALGDSHPAARDRYFSSHNGLVAVYARELTRQAIWEAFFQRRTYATNGPRVVLDVRLGGVLMGGETSAPAGTVLKLGLLAHLDGWLDAIEILRDGTAVQYLQGGDQQNQIREFRQEVDIPVEAGCHAWGVKVRQTDGGAAWSSPIWVTARP